MAKTEDLKRAEQTDHLSLVRCLSLAILLLSCSSCFYKFPVDLGDDASVGTASTMDKGTETHVDGDSDAVTDPCPSAIMFQPELAFTEMAAIKDITTGDEYVDSCEPGSVIIGYQGFFHQGTVIISHGRIQAICGKLSVQLVDDECVVRVEVGGNLPMRGDKGTIEWQRVCEQDEVLMGYLAKTGSSMNSLTFACAPLEIELSTNEPKISRGFSSYLPLAGSGTGPVPYQGFCPEGQVATSSLTRADQFVMSFGLGCQNPIVTY